MAGPVLDLTESNPTRCGFSFYSGGLLEPLSDRANLVYEPDPGGLPEARRAVCRYYAEKGITVRPEQVFLTAGTSEAYSYLFRLLADPGEKIAVPVPSYPLFHYLADLSDTGIAEYPLVYEDGWRADRAALEKAAGEDVRALIVVNPNHPTGHFTGGGEKAFLARFCRERGMAVISDEVFLDFPLEQGARPESFAGNGETLTFTLSGISKVLGLPQMKLSWIVVSGPEDERREAAARLEMIADTYLSVNTPSQRALSPWLAARHPLLREIGDRLAGNLETLARAVAASRRARLLRAEGGWYAILALEGPRTDEAVALELLEKEGVLVHPGYLFDFEAGSYIVLSLLPASEDFSEGVRRLARSLFF
jgi:aspartate/methionine/tyrosine aminotransferase